MYNFNSILKAILIKKLIVNPLINYFNLLYLLERKNIYFHYFLLNPHK